MERSREYRADAERLLDLQGEMVDTLLDIEESQRNIQSDLAAATSAKESEREEAIATIGLCKQVHLIIKWIADGMAWRAFGYDRAVIHQLALKPHSGHLELKTVTQELAVAASHADQTGNLVILNDLTNFLRYGDFTSIGPEKIGIHEVKAGRGSARSGQASRQRRKALSTIEFLKTGRREGPGVPERLLRFRTEPTSHLHEVHDVISKARAAGSAYRRLSDCLAVQVFEVHQMSEALVATQPGARKLVRNPFTQSRDSVTRHSFEVIQAFTPNLAPYSVFPFSADDCADVMLGNL